MAHVARKRFGQHFLADRSVIARIVDAIAPRDGERLLEIGPGQGALTSALLQRVAHLDAIEIDRDLAAGLRRRYGDRLALIEGDVLAVDLADVLGSGPVRLVGNLPYNISSPLLIHASRWAAHIIDQHFMLQREVVDRIVAAPGPDLGRLTVVLQNHYRVLSLFDVPPEAFDPPPRVQSSVIRMTPREQPLTTAVAQLEAVLGVAFGQRRKMLRATVGRWLAEHHPGVDLVTAHETDPRLLPFADVTLRPEAIPVEAWCALADRIAAGSGRAST